MPEIIGLVTMVGDENEAQFCYAALRGRSTCPSFSYEDIQDLAFVVELVLLGRLGSLKQSPSQVLTIWMKL